MGHLEKEVSSCAAMTGCLGREDVEVTILSKQYTETTMFRWTADDRVQVIESPFRKVNRINIFTYPLQGPISKIIELATRNKFQFHVEFSLRISIQIMPN